MSYTLPIGLNISAWEEWCEYRRIEKRNKVGPIGAKKQFAILLKYTIDEQQEIIDTSIAGGWTGLFDLKTANKPPAQADTFDLLTDRSWAQDLVDGKAIEHKH